VHRERPMEYDDFVRHLRQALVTVGLSEQEAAEYSAHSIRSGAATEAVHSEIPPLRICHLAGVKSTLHRVARWLHARGPRRQAPCVLVPRPLTGRLVAAHTAPAPLNGDCFCLASCVICAARPSPPARYPRGRARQLPKTPRCKRGQGLATITHFRVVTWGGV
jgi:hypothetical protein